MQLALVVDPMTAEVARTEKVVEVLDHREHFVAADLEAQAQQGSSESTPNLAAFACCWRPSPNRGTSLSTLDESLILYGLQNYNQRSLKTLAKTNDSMLVLGANTF